MKPFSAIIRKKNKTDTKNNLVKISLKPKRKKKCKSLENSKRRQRIGKARSMPFELKGPRSSKNEVPESVKSWNSKKGRDC